MGLDNIGIILRVEDEFSISVPDEEAASVQTVGDLFQLVLNVTGTDSESLSSRIFYRIRKAVEETLGMQPRMIHSGTWLEPLLRRETRLAQWSEIGKRSRLKLPKLVHPRGWRDSFMMVSMLCAVVPVVALWWSLDVIGWLPGIARWAFVLPALIAWVVLVSRINQKLLNATPGLCYEVPCATAKELAEAALELNIDDLGLLSGTGAPAGEEQIWKRIVDILSEELQVTPQEVTPGMRITEGLGVR